MNHQTPDPKLAHFRIYNFVKSTRKRSFTSKYVAAQPFTLNRLEHAGLLKSLGKECVESDITTYHLPEGAITTQETYFRKELAQIREWSRTTHRHTFRPSNVQIHDRTLEKMVSHSILSKTGNQYTIFWRSLNKQWTER